MGFTRKTEGSFGGGLHSGEIRGSGVRFPTPLVTASGDNHWSDLTKLWEDAMRPCMENPQRSVILALNVVVKMIMPQGTIGSPVAVATPLLSTLSHTPCSGVGCDPDGYYHSHLTDEGTEAL